MSEIKRPSIFSNVPNLVVEVERVSTDPDTDRETTVELMRKELQSTDQVCRYMYTVSDQDNELRVSIMNGNAVSCKIQAFYICDTGCEPVDSIGIYELFNLIRTKSNKYVRDRYVMNVTRTRETIRICDANEKTLLELVFQTQID